MTARGAIVEKGWKRRKEIGDYLYSQLVTAGQRRCGTPTDRTPGPNTAPQTLREDLVVAARLAGGSDGSADAWVTDTSLSRQALLPVKA